MTKPWNDVDPIETQEWLDALASVIENEGLSRAHDLLAHVMEQAGKSGVALQKSLLTTPYCNTISREEEPVYPGDLALEAQIEAINRWNAIVMVLRAKKDAEGVGGHLASYASIATAYEVGLNHFFHGAAPGAPGDLIYFQGHSCEGNYARAYLEGRLTEAQLLNFRQEVHGNGVSSYPHPWLMPTFWQFATVSLGLGALQALYQARFLKYLENRQLVKTEHRKVWVFCGDGEMDEPESIAGLTMAARENLDNVIYVVNCNLQRLDGLVRSNSKIIQELESLFRGAGWNVIKVIWDSRWDAILKKDKKGLILKKLNNCVDGELQSAYVNGQLREFLQGEDEELAALLRDISNDDLLLFNRGGHDAKKIYAAYQAAIHHKNQPTVILLQSVKGYGLGITGAEGRNIAHNQLEMTEVELKAFRDRFKLPLTDQQLADLSFYKPADHTPEMRYLHAQREKLTGFIPERVSPKNPLTIPTLSAFEMLLKGSGDRTLSTTMVLGRILSILLKEKELGPRLVPIFSDEVRTFGLESLFRQIGIYSHVGQLYTPEDKEQFLYYRETQEGQVLEEGITEAGCMASWIAAATSYSTHQFPMIPFFTYYSMFGFQRVGDFIWAAADMRSRGFLIGATAGRTTLAGEGLQHQDGNSLLTASAVPNCKAYDPAFGYEMAVIIQHGLHEMYGEERDVFYYIMAMNEKYIHPEMPAGVEEGIIKGMYLFQAGPKASADRKVQLFGSGAILREVIFAADLLQHDFNVSADIWSITSFNELQREASALERKARFSPEAPRSSNYIATCLKNHKGPVIAATDYIRSYAEQIRSYVNRSYTVLGTDGFGRSDTRERLRHFFEVDRYHIVVAALFALAEEGILPVTEVTDALKKYNIDANKLNPMTV